MKALIQRVSSASVSIQGQIVATIEHACYIPGVSRAVLPGLYRGLPRP